MTYTRKVRYAVPPESPVITRTEVYYINVLCVLRRSVTPDGDFELQTRTVPPQPGHGQFDVQLMFFKDSHFQVRCSQALQVHRQQQIKEATELHSLLKSPFLLIRKTYSKIMSRTVLLASIEDFVT